ncbi:B-Box-type zinc finger [Ancistrocladus abbreviatus]
MCQGRRQGSQESPASARPSSSSMDAPSCELCGSKATIYCQADDAYLCRKCDHWVHGANFLANRHIRCLLCNTCQKFTQRYLLGSSAEVMLPSILGWKRSRQYDPSSSFDDSQNECSRSLKMPFLFL